MQQLKDREMNNIKISIFKSIRSSVTPIGTASLLDAVTSDKYSPLVEEHRSYDKCHPRAIYIKEEVLPAITVSGLFSQRNSRGLIEHSGYVCLDYDNVDDPEALKQWLSSIDFIAFASLSVGGRGVFALVKIADTAKHAEYLRAIFAYFENYNVELDKKCTDVGRLRVVSYDSNPYINLDAHIWDKTITPQHSRQVTPLYYNNGDVEERLFIAGLEYIESRAIDITAGYSNWLALGSCIKTLFGCRGEECFQRLSQFHSNYKREECSQKWRSCADRGYGFGIFANACKRAGMPNLRDLLR